MIMKNRLTLQTLTGRRWWLIGLLVFFLMGLGPISEAGAQESEPESAASASAAGVLVFQTGSGGAIYAVNADGTNLRYLTTGMDPALSPDGQSVAFTRWQTSQDGALGSVWVINVDGSGERVIHENLYNPRTPVWSADGTQLAITMQHGGYVQERNVCGDLRPPREAENVSIEHDEDGDIKFCYTLPADPHWSLRLIDLASGAFEDQAGDDYSFSPAWDPANPARLVYNGAWGLVNLDLNQQTTSALTGDVNDHSPVFSPDGSQIAVSYWQTDHWEVHVLNADGSGRIRLTETSYLAWVQQELNGEEVHSYNNAAPVWSPDGSRLAFLTDRTGQWEIWVMNADGSSQQPLIPAGALAGISLQYNGVDEQMISWR
jgi:dipeptidyl aminopeptidase/acylaminoacyl peptidase